MVMRLFIQHKKSQVYGCGIMTDNEGRIFCAQLIINEVYGKDKFKVIKLI